MDSSMDEEKNGLHEIPKEFFGKALLELQNDPDHNLLGQCIAEENSFDKGKGKYVRLRAYRLYVKEHLKVKSARRERRSGKRGRSGKS